MKTPIKGFEDSKEFGYDFLSSASSQDCTGLMPNLPQTAEEMDSYHALYPFLAAFSDNMSDDDMPTY